MNFWAEDKLGRLKFEFITSKSGAPNLTVSELTWDHSIYPDLGLLAICQNTQNLTIHFDTGHTFSQDQIYEAQLHDVPFESWKWIDFGALDIDESKEKPLHGKRFAAETIGNNSDKSLFGYIVNHWPESAKARALAHSGSWLVCDDGAGEVADFIHFDQTQTPPKLTLIHAKGSGSSSATRGISVSDYEVVVGQAIKNLRHLNLADLHQKLSTSNASKLADAVWLNGNRQPDRQKFLQAIELASSNLTLEVAVLQPSVRKAEHDNVRSSVAQGNSTTAQAKRLKQLDTLLLGAQASCRSFGAEFRVYAAK